MSNRQRKGRELNGLLLLDKPTGITSNLALQKVKKLFNAAKAGHTGSLDPLATGMLIICFGRATKISKFLLDADKQYEVSLLLGVSTDSGDADGVVLEKRDTSQVTQDAVLQSLKSFTGRIQQIPSMFSALKHQGTRLHKLARQGVEIKRPSREVQIFKLELIAREGDQLTLRVHCSKGTYIRTLVEDLGKKLGCGAHVVKLRRTSVGSFDNLKMVPLPELEEYADQQPSYLHTLLLPADTALQAYPAVSVSCDVMQDIQNGQLMCVEEIPSNGFVRIYDENNTFYGLGRVLEDGRIAPKCLN